MDPVTGFLAGRLFKWLGSLAILGCLALGVMLLAEKIENRSLTKTVAQRDAQIQVLNRDLAHAQTNVATLQHGIEERNRKIRDVSDQGKRRLAEAGREVEAAKAETARANRRAEQMLRYQPKGETAGERMLDVDRQFLETLK